MLDRLMDATIDLGLMPVTGVSAAGGSGAVRSPSFPWRGQAQAASAVVARHGAALAVQQGIVMIGKRGGDLEKAAAWIVGHNVPIQWVATIDAAQRMLRAGQRPSHLFIDIDDLGSINTCIEDLISLRKTVADVAVILFSKEFQSDDFDLNRIVLGDVCLRAPVNFNALAMAMPVASQHNRIWQERQRLS